jgi:DsbC/DsbD-like thiol-disulfide interchange protein
MNISQNVAVAGSLGLALLWPLAPASAVAARAAGPQEPPPPPKMPGRQPPGQMPGDSPFAPDAQSGKHLVKMRMASDVARIAPGETFHLAFIFDIEPKWHIYWQNAGASGTPTEVGVKAPPGFTVGRTLFPRPHIIHGAEGITYGYEGQAVLLVEITAPESAMSQVTFNTRGSWLVCKEICKMGSASDSITMPFGRPSIPGPDDTVDPIVDTFKQRVPKALKDLKAAEAKFDGTTLALLIPSQKFDTAEFFPDHTPGVEYGEPQVERSGAFVRVTVPVKVEPQNALGKPLRVAGVVGLGASQDDPSYQFEIPLDEQGKPASGAPVNQRTAE